MQRTWSRRFTRAVLMGLLLASSSILSRDTGAAPLGAPVVSGDKTYTTDADFDQGNLVNVNHNAPNSNQLQLNPAVQQFPFVNIAASARGTIVRIDANTGAILGEYQTAPDLMGRNPSRTTVDIKGNVWVANRDEGGESPAGSGESRGSVARVGLVTGGTRANADGTANPGGDYLKGPFSYNTCVDRNSDTLIKTSRGLGDIRPWLNSPVPPATDGPDIHGGVSTADDECIINYTRVAGTATRTVAVDSNNDVWTGGLGDLDHEKISGVTGQPIAGTMFNLGCGGYGGLIDKNGVLWSAQGGNNLLRYNPATGTGACLDSTHGNYGLGLDPSTGEIWHTFVSSLPNGHGVAKLRPDGTVLGTFNHGNTNAQGVAVDKNGNVWVAHSLFGATTVGHLRTDGTFVGNVSLTDPGTGTVVGSGPTGVAVDANGKVWVANLGSNNAMRINPTAGAAGGGGFPIGAVDLVVDLGAGAGPYNYSDMTGLIAQQTTTQGTWTVIQDNGNANGVWGTITWNAEPQGSQPAGTNILVEARAANTVADLVSHAFTPVSNGVAFSNVGRFIEVRATLTPDASGTSPVLSDIKVAWTGQVAQNPPTHLTVAAVTPDPPYTAQHPAPKTFSVTVEVRDSSEALATVSQGTLVRLSVLNGAGSLGGTTSGTIAQGNSSVTINGVTYSQGDSGVRLRADDDTLPNEVSETGLFPGDSPSFDVIAVPTKLVITDIQPPSPNPAPNTFSVTVQAQDNNGSLSR